MSNKNPNLKTFDNFTVSTEFNQSSVDVQEKKVIYVDEEIMMQQNQKKEKQGLSGFQQIFLIICLSILVVFLMVFVAIALQYVFSKDLHPQKKSQNIDQESSFSKKFNVNQLQNQEIKYDSEIQRLQSKIKELEQQLKSQKQEIHQLKETIQSLMPQFQGFIANQNNMKKQNKDTGKNQKTQNDLKNKKPGQKNTLNKTEYQNNQIYFKVREIQRKNIPPKLNQGDRYDLSLSIDKIIYQSNLKTIYQNDGIIWSGIKKDEYERAIRLLQVVHNVNYKGEFVFDHCNFYSSPQAKAQALFKVLQQEKQYLDMKYGIEKYIHDQIGMCVYVPSYNNAKNRLYLRNLDSIFQQEYQNYHVVYINDASTDGTGEYVKMYMEENEIPAEKYVIINNEKNKGNCANIYNAGHNYCKEGEIMVMLDGDDALIGRQVFSLLNAVYQKEKVALTYSQFILVRQNLVSNGFSRYIPDNSLRDGTFRQLKSFFTSHLKTMYVDVFRQIKVTDLQYDNGTFYDSASDVAFMTTAIELVGPRMKFLTQISYEYRFDTGFNDAHNKQMVIEAQVYLKTPSKKLQNMTFADSPKTIHYP